ncbi:MAG: DUF1549 domain-containing protein [Gemmataceae bacterium]
MKRSILAWGVFVALSATSLRADDVKKSPPAKPSLPTGHLRTEDWLTYSTDRLAAGEIDRLVSAELKKAGIKEAPLANDETYLRRVYLDLIGRVPTPKEIAEFKSDTQPTKRSAVVDRLLETDEYAKHWAAYWRESISRRTTDNRAQIFARGFETWMADQFKQNRSWGSIVRELLTASGQLRFAEPTKNGSAYFLASRTGADAPTELASEASRLFLGIQIQCAQCHDHPSDVWKRNQFHEFAAFFARVRQAPIREEMKIVGFQLIAAPFGEHQMPNASDAKKPGKRIDPQFLDGKGPGSGQTDAKRREYLAAKMTSTQDPWFGGAFVNRIWGELMGQAFYQPVDDMGPEKEATMPTVLARIAGSFRGSEYDVKQLFRDLMASETYQRQIRPGASIDEHLMFAASHPKRMQADALWASLNQVLGPISSGRGFFGKGPAAGGFGRFGGVGLEQVFKREFGFDPSAKAEDIEGSISQALLMMNNPQIAQKITAKGDNMLAAVLKANAKDDDAIRTVYLRTLAREPSEREMTRCKTHISSVASRSEAYEDILWAILNSAEFQTKK